MGRHRHTQTLMWRLTQPYGKKQQGMHRLGCRLEKQEHRVCYLVLQNVDRHHYALVEKGRTDAGTVVDPKFAPMGNKSTDVHNVMEVHFAHIKNRS